MVYQIFCLKKSDYPWFHFSLESVTSSEVTSGEASQGMGSAWKNHKQTPSLLFLYIRLRLVHQWSWFGLTMVCVNWHLCANGESYFRFTWCFMGDNNVVTNFRGWCHDFFSHLKINYIMYLIIKICDFDGGKLNLECSL